MTPVGDRREPSTWPEALRQAMSALPPSKTLYVALSGGVDSLFLLHAVVGWYSARQDVVVRAIHVNHQLQISADQMEAFCQSACDELGVALTVCRIDISQPTDSLENQARKARYRAFEDILLEGDLLLLGHHADDQAETVLFRLIRGTGVRGLSGMPVSRPLGSGMLYRPLLPLTREMVEGLARDWGLVWQDDPTNSDTRFDRNYLRHDVLPAIKRRWPSVLTGIGRSARHCEESEQLSRSLAMYQRRDIEDDQRRLRVGLLAELPFAEQKNVFRWWITDHGCTSPGAAKQAQGFPDLLAEDPRRTPELCGDGYRILRYADWLYLAIDQPEPPARIVWTPNAILRWGQFDLEFSSEGAVQVELVVTRRQGGERFRPRPGGPSRPLKKWLQEQAVPPWERDRLPLVWYSGELVAIADLWLSRSLLAENEPSPLRIVRRRNVVE
ncbi:tRNA lysidine(34) synthetase TilS [Marinobacter sp. 1Y8]